MPLALERTWQRLPHSAEQWIRSASRLMINDTRASRWA